MSDHLDIDSYITSSSIVTCIYCGKKYEQIRTDQTPGFRDRDYDICPYCHKKNGSSMSYEFDNRPIKGA